MATKQTKKVKRTQKYPNIYYNESTGKYDVKYNYKEYSPTEGKNVYKAKWVYNCVTVGEAKAALANLRAGGVKEDDKDITLQGILEFWKLQANHVGYSSQTIFNTEQQLKAISKALPLDTKLKNITEQVYYDTFNQLEKIYSGETLHSLESTLRKLLQLAFEKGFIANNFLQKTKRKETLAIQEPKVMKSEDFKKIFDYLDSKRDVRHKGYCAYPKLLFFYSTLYYTGMRLGECLALTWADFEEFNYYSEEEQRKKENFHLWGTNTNKDNHLVGVRVNVTKSILCRTGEIKAPKNKKNRTIPLPPTLELLYHAEHYKHTENGGSESDRVFTYSHTHCLTKLKEICKELELDTDYNCHTFRHTYISNLMNENIPLPVIEKVSGDTQQTIFRRYSHMFEGEERLVLEALANIDKQ